MNFVCNLRRLGIYDQLVIAAFDQDMYRFGFRMGLPVFFYEVCEKGAGGVTCSAKLDTRSASSLSSPPHMVVSLPTLFISLGQQHGGADGQRLGVWLERL